MARLTVTEKRVIRAAMRWYGAMNKHGQHYVSARTWAILENSCAALAASRRGKQRKRGRG